MKSSIGVGLAAVACGVLLAGVAEARNPHCAGGIQYVTQALRDKDKGNLDDYRREINKAVQQLEKCETEDPNDFEGVGYLGYAYAEVDSAAQAGRAFAKAIAGLTAKGDKKKVDWAIANRDHFWTIAYNAGIAKITAAQAAYGDYCAKPSGPEEQKLKDEATSQYDAAIHSLTRAASYRPAEAQTLRNLATVYALRCEFARAETAFGEALEVAPNDKDLAEAVRNSRVSQARVLIEAKDYDGAIALYARLAPSSPNDAGVQTGLADAYFKRAQTWTPDALPAARVEGLKKVAPNEAELGRLKEVVSDSLRKSDFKRAGDAYGKAAAVKSDNPDLPFNAALAYQSADESGLAEAQWRAALKLKPNDPDILSSLGSTLADEKKFEDAIKILHQAVVADPKNRTFHRQLGAVYTKAGNNAKGTEELMVFLALQNGKESSDAAGQAKKAPAGSAAAKALADLGPPEQLNHWEAEKEKYETWFYWNKRAAYHFKAGTLVVKSEWSAPDLKTAAGGAK